MVDVYGEWVNKDAQQFRGLVRLLESDPEYANYETSQAVLRQKRPNRFDGAVAATIDLGDLMLEAKTLGQLGNRVLVSRLTVSDGCQISSSFTLQDQTGVFCSVWYDGDLNAWTNNPLVHARAGAGEARECSLEFLSGGQDSRAAARAAQQWWRDEVVFAHLLNVLLRRGKRTVTQVQQEIGVPQSKLYQYLMRRGIKFVARPRSTIKIIASVRGIEGHIAEQTLIGEVVSEDGLPDGEAWVRVRGAPSWWRARWSPANWAYCVRDTMPPLGTVSWSEALPHLRQKYHASDAELREIAGAKGAFCGSRVFVAHLA